MGRGSLPAGRQGSRQLPQRSPIGGLFCFVLRSEICIQWVRGSLPAGRQGSRQLPQRSPSGGLFCFVVLSEICIQWVAIPCLPAGRDPVNSHRGHQLVAFFVEDNFYLFRFTIYRQKDHIKCSFSSQFISKNQIIRNTYL